MAGTSPAMTAVRIANCPAGKSVDTVSSHVAKNIFLSLSGKSLLELPRLVPTQGAFRDRHGRWHGMRWTRLVLLTNGTEADGEVVWS